MKRLILVVCFLASVLAAGAMDLSQYGITVVGSAAEGKRTAVTLRDADGFAFTIRYSVEPAEDIQERISQLKDVFSGWQNIRLSALSFTVTGSLVEALAVPEKFLIDGEDIHELVPAGLFFSSTSEGVEYDFRLTKNNLFLRLQGAYVGEESFEKRVAEAVANPEMFLQRSDPEYFFSRLEEAERLVAGVSSRADILTQTSQELSSVDEELKQKDSEITDSLGTVSDSIGALSDSIGVLSDTVNGLTKKLGVMSASLETLSRQKDELVKRNEALMNEIEKTRAAAMTDENVDWFTKKPISRDTVARILDAKRENPGLKAEEISARFKKASLKIPDREIKIVLKYYFGE